MRTRNALVGLVIVGGYLMSAVWTLGPGQLPVRPFFDGTHTPVAYRWVNPPSDVVGNVAPEAASKTISFVERETAEGKKVKIFEGGTVTTGDGQVALSIPSTVFAPIEGVTGVEVTVTPMDPAVFGEPPKGVAYDGNAVEVSAMYVPTGEPAELAPQDCELGGCMTLIVRYPGLGDRAWFWTESAWEEIEVTQTPASYQVWGSIQRSGVYAVTALPHASAGSLRNIVAFSAGGIAVIGSLAFARMRRKPKGSSSKSKPAGKGRGRKGRPSK